MPTTSRVKKPMVTCKNCAVSVRIDRLETHMVKVHKVQSVHIYKESNFMDRLPGAVAKPVSVLCSAVRADAIPSLDQFSEATNRRGDKVATVVCQSDNTLLPDIDLVNAEIYRAERWFDKHDGARCK